MTTKRQGGARGTASVEFALMGTLLMLLGFGAADFGRVFLDGLAVSNSAGTAAFYGAYDNINAGDFEAIRTRAREDAENDVGTVTPTVTQICQCPGNAPFPCVDYGTVTCSGYGAPRAYVRVQVEEPLESISQIPILPTATIGRQAWMRVR